MKKIGFVVPWYGEKISGGAESETRDLVKNLHAKGIEVEILTTCVKQFTSDWNKNHYKPGNYLENGITVKRFKVRKRNTEKFDIINSKLMYNHSINHKDEKIFFEEMIRSFELEKYIEEFYNDYSFFCYIPYMFGTTYWGIKKSKEKSILIPCLHDEPYAYMGLLKETFNSISGCIFLADPEKELAEKLYKLENIETMVVGAGLNTNLPENLEGFQKKYKINNPYILYAGRKDKGKNIDLLIKYFKIFKKRNSDYELDLVLIGGGTVDIPNEIKKYVFDLGFIDLEDKYKCYSNALTLVQPSLNESFSIVIMESWLTGRPVIVNEKCDVTKNFAIKSNGGLYFNNYVEFEEILKLYIKNKEKANELGKNGKKYVIENFDREKKNKKYIDFFLKLENKRGE